MTIKMEQIFRMFFVFFFLSGNNNTIAQIVGGKHYTDSLILLSESQDIPDTLRTRLYIDIGIALKEADNELAWKYMELGSRGARNTSNPWLISRSIMLEVTLTGLKGDAEKLRELALKYEPELLRYGYPVPISSLYNELARAAYKSGDYSLAGELFSRVVETGRKFKLHKLELVALINLGAMYETQGRYREMRDQMLIVLSLARQYNCPEEVDHAHINLGYAEYQLKNYGTAMEYLKGVIPILEAKNNKLRLSYCYGSLAACLKDIGRYEEAIEYARKSAEIRKIMNDDSGYARALINLGEVQMRLSMLDSAEYSLKLSIEKSKKLNARLILVEAYKLLAGLYAEKGNFLSAYDTQLKHIALKDSVYRIEKDEKLNQQLNLLKASQTDSLARSVNMGIESGKKEADILFILFLIALGLTGAASYYLSVFSAKKIPSGIAGYDEGHTRYHELILELESRNRQLREELLETKQAIHQLETEHQQAVSDSIEALREIARRAGDTENSWNEFMLLFSRVYPLFFEQLKHLYPALTPNELRFCAFLKIGLAQSDIASALHISTESVRKARYRLYRRMGLQSDLELLTLVENLI